MMIFLWFENVSLCAYIYICIFVKQYHTSTGPILVLYLSAKHIVQIIQPTGFLSTVRVGNIHWHKMKGYYRHPYEYMVLHVIMIIIMWEMFFRGSLYTKNHVFTSYLSCIMPPKNVHPRSTFRSLPDPLKIKEHVLIISIDFCNHHVKNVQNHFCHVEIFQVFSAWNELKKMKKKKNWSHH